MGVSGGALDAPGGLEPHGGKLGRELCHPRHVRLPRLALLQRAVAAAQARSHHALEAGIAHARLLQL